MWIDPADSAVTLAEWVARWFRSLDLDPRTIESYRSRVNLVVDDLAAMVSRIEAEFPEVSSGGGAVEIRDPDGRVVRISEKRAPGSAG
ncbi:hypothetical protein [Amycolatopsis australiensis]|uniref:hypothetical protein n=1 Tax=Amycolatopsis australiensis TaxID=546364 RepID=UPI0011615336|nr:hypothetical protein [Amycolatopsis australiensis]